MANSLGFLNKPAPAKPATSSAAYNPLSSANAGSKPAPKAFLDKSNPWAVGSTPAPRPAPRTQTPAARATPQPQRAPAPTQAAARSTPEPRQAAPARAPARPLPQPVPTPIQMVAPRPTPQPAAPWQMAPSPEQAMAMRPMGQPTPQPGRQPAQPWQMAPTAEQAMAMRSTPAPGQPAAPAAPIVPTNAWLLDGIQPGQPPTPGQPIAPSQQPAPGQPTPPAPGQPSAPTPQPEARGPFYGYAPPGPLTAARPYTPQRAQLTPYMTDRPNYSGWGQRALLSDEALAVEDARRQRDAAGSFGALQLSGRFRPWSSYSAAEKYQIRYGIAPQGEQSPAPTSGIEAMEASRQQTDRLKNEYKATYGRYPKWDNYAYRRPDQLPGAIAQGQSTAPAAPVTATAPTEPAQAAQIAKNNQMILTINPQAATTGVTDQDANTVAREIAKRYLPDKDVSTLTLADIGAILAMSYTPPPGLEQQFGYDMDWLTQLLPSE